MEFELIEACGVGNLQKVKFLLEKGADIHTNHAQALIWAASNGHLEVVKFLIEKDTDIYDLALIWAAESGHLEVVKFLVEKGADINANDNESLRRASNNGHIEVVNYLRQISGKKYKCHECLIRATCLNLCEGFNGI